jgi:hypothetical protein
MVTGTELAPDERTESNGQRTKRRASAKLWVAAVCFLFRERLSQLRMREL